MSTQSTDTHQAKRPRIGERTMLACIGCKQKKLKICNFLTKPPQCDGQIPKCQNCVRTRRDCLVEDPGTGLHRPRDYMKSLEARVAYLEGLLQQVRPEVALDHLGPNQSRNANNMAPYHTDPTQPNSTNHVDVLSSEVALLCLSAAGREPHYFGPSSAVSFSRIVSATMGLCRSEGSSQHGPAGRGKRYGTEVPREASLRLPSPALRTSLSEAYFNNIHPQYPFLHELTFRTWEENCLESSHEGHINGVSWFFALMVYAIGSLVLGQNHYDAAETYYSMALDHISAVLDLDNLASIQAILSCAVYSIRSPVGVSLWKVSGMAIRHCVELGYHRSAERYHKNTDALTKEMSKRCFWLEFNLLGAAYTHCSSVV
ncbi:hypothetical protein LX32DRAFT_721986 [Colletotrichum zoysiae]|uniref:Xylanolytic transcriptional activator regulatory domain-containing protein n=1 Tax=Colletotrichum zoysiae TaxID=1216348 RepID=A0AAD9HED1_9PEZI|nr:hypothetical protein LX32DRAFT_721986 [Colletotrichum zoysiae]